MVVIGRSGHYKGNNRCNDYYNMVEMEDDIGSALADVTIIVVVESQFGKNLFIWPRLRLRQIICHSKELVKLSRLTPNQPADSILSRDTRVQNGQNTFIFTNN